MPKIKNIIIFIAIAASLVLVYVFFIKKDVPQDNLVSSPAANLPSVNSSNTSDNSNQTSDADTQVFLTQLLNVKNIKLNVAIFSDPAWISLHDSSITLVPDGTEGRSNPFAAIGNDTVVLPATTSTTTGAAAASPAPAGNAPAPMSPPSPSPANNN